MMQILPIRRPAALLRAIAPSRYSFAPSNLHSLRLVSPARSITTSSSLLSETAPSTAGDGPSSVSSAAEAVPTFPVRTNYPYHVGRTTSNNLPVYEKKSRSNPETVTWTEIRRIDGDQNGLKAMKAELEEYLGFTGASAADATALDGANAPAPRRRRPNKKKQKDTGIKINPTTSHLIVPVSL